MRERSIPQAILAGYERIPAGTPDEWGDLDELSARCAEDVAWRLDEDERVSGLDG